MVIQQRESVTASGQRSEVSFEVNLPQAIGGVMLEAQPGLGSTTGLGRDEPMTMQDVGNGAGRKLRLAKVKHSLGDLATSPGRVLTAQLQYRLLNRIGTARG